MKVKVENRQTNRQKGQKHAGAWKYLCVYHPQSKPNCTTCKLVWLCCWINILYHDMNNNQSSKFSIQLFHILYLLFLQICRITTDVYISIVRHISLLYHDDIDVMYSKNKTNHSKKIRKIVTVPIIQVLQFPWHVNISVNDRMFVQSWQLFTVKANLSSKISS